MFIKFSYFDGIKSILLMTELNFFDYKDKIIALRQTVWEQTDHAHMEQVFLNGFYDEHDNKAFHWGVFDDNEILIASARLSKHLSVDTLPDQHLLMDLSDLGIVFPIGSLNRLSVERSYQGIGLSDEFDKVRIAKALQQACKSVCAMTYGHRGLKLLHDGFRIYPLLKISKNFKTDKDNAKQLPPAFYYKPL